MDLRIGLINTQGLGDGLKRREIFNWLKRKNMSVYFIQEAHCTEDSIHDWRAEWGYQALFSCCSSNKAGVAILFNNNFSFQLSKAYIDPKGRFIICDLTTNAHIFWACPKTQFFWTNLKVWLVLPSHCWGDNLRA